MALEAAPQAAGPLEEDALGREALLSLPPQSREAVITRLVRAEVARVLRVAPTSITPDAPLGALGLDSLSAVELGNALEARFGIALPLSTVLEGPPLEKLAALAMAALEAPAVATAAPPAAPSAAPGDYPLAPGQWGLWFAHQLSPDTAEYNIANAVAVRSALDVPRLRAAANALVARHTALRTVFVRVDGEPVQRVLASAGASFQHEDASAWSEAQLRQRLDAEALRPFDLAQGPLLRILAYSRSATEHVLLLVVHHIVADLGSLAVVVQDLGAFYTALGKGDAPGLPPVQSDSVEHARWLRDHLARDGERLWSYWRVQLAGEVPSLSLPSFRARPAVQTYTGDARGFRLSAQLSARLMALARETGTTPYALLLAAFQALLHRYSGQEDLWVGSPTSGRTRPHLAGTVGYLVNMVVLRGDLSGDPSFMELLDRTRRAVVDAVAHQELPFPWVVERLNARRDPSRHPLHQVAFVFQKSQLADQEMLGAFALGEGGARLRVGELTFEALPLTKRVTPYDLTLTFAELEGTLAGSLQYNADLFQAGIIDQLSRHLVNLLEGIAADPKQRVSALPLLSTDEQQALTRPTATRVTLREGQVCLHHRFARQVAERGDAEAVSYESQRLTYRQLDARANQLAHHLQRHGVGHGDRVGLYLERSLDMVVAVLGILKAGATYVPIDTAYPPERVQFMLEDSQARVLVTQEKLADGVSGGPARVLLDAGAAAIAREPADAPAVASTGEDIAYVIYTSGSTGRPKGVLVTARQRRAPLRRHLAIPTASTRPTSGRCSTPSPSTSPSGSCGARCCTAGASSWCRAW